MLADMHEPSASQRKKNSKIHPSQMAQIQYHQSLSFLKRGLTLIATQIDPELQDDNQFENQRYQSKSFKYERNDQTPPGGYFSSNNISTQPSQPMDNYLISKQVIDSPIQYKSQRDKEPSFVQESSLNNSTDDEKYFKNMKTSVQVQAKKAVTQIQQKVKEYLNELRSDICRFLETLMADQGILMDDILHFTEMQEIQCFIENPIKLKNQEVDQFSFESIIRIGVKKLLTLKERFLQNESINNAQTTKQENKGQVKSSIKLQDSTINFENDYQLPDTQILQLPQKKLSDNLGNIRSGFNSINNSKRGVDQKRVSFDNEEKEQLNQPLNQYENRPKDYVSKSQMSKYSPNQVQNKRLNSSQNPFRLNKLPQIKQKPVTVIRQNSRIRDSQNLLNRSLDQHQQTINEALNSYKLGIPKDLNQTLRISQRTLPKNSQQKHQQYMKIQQQDSPTEFTIYSQKNLQANQLNQDKIEALKKRYQDELNLIIHEEEYKELQRHEQMQNPLTAYERQYLEYVQGLERAKARDKLSIVQRKYEQLIAQAILINK
eukprot:403344600